MTVDQPDRSGACAGKRVPAVAALAIALAGVGWFVLSHNVMGTTIGDALGETVGVVLALLVVASMVGAITAGRGNRR